jgi:hydroxymethylbilane synthase
LDHRNTRQSVLAERAFLRGLGGGCSLPIAALGLVQEDRLILNGAVFRPDGSQIIQANLAGPLARAEHVGEELAQELRAKGAERLIGSS